MTKREKQILKDIQKFERWVNTHVENPLKNTPTLSHGKIDYISWGVNGGARPVVTYRDFRDINIVNSMAQNNVLTLAEDVRITMVTGFSSPKDKRHSDWKWLIGLIITLLIALVGLSADKITTLLLPILDQPFQSHSSQSEKSIHP